jgi:hypothetical protein
VTRILDELAEALHGAEGSPVPRRVVSSVELWRQFRLPITPARWRAVSARLGLPLPPLLRQCGNLWTFPEGWTTVFDLAEYIARHWPEWTAPDPCKEADWREAQVFAGVRACLMEACNLDADEVVRPARLMADLRMA